MLQSRWFSAFLSITLLTSTTACLALPFSADALASYNPRNPSRPTRGTGSTATRGGCEEAVQLNSTVPVSLTTLAPRAHIGRTSSTHPTFAWYVADRQSYPIEITLFEYGENGRGKPIQTFKDLPSSPGVMHWTLPKDQPGLTVGKTYLWQVALICNAIRPSKNQWMEAVIEVVEPPASLQTTLAQMTDPVQRAQVYAQADLWYEAFAETLKNPAAKPFQLTLLQQLSQLELPQQRSQLQTIIDRARQSSLPTLDTPNSR